MCEFTGYDVYLERWYLKAAEVSILPRRRADGQKNSIAFIVSLRLYLLSRCRFFLKTFRKRQTVKDGPVSAAILAEWHYSGSPEKLSWLCVSEGSVVWGSRCSSNETRLQAPQLPQLYSRHVLKVFQETPVTEHLPSLRWLTVTVCLEPPSLRCDRFYRLSSVKAIKWNGFVNAEWDAVKPQHLRGLTGAVTLSTLIWARSSQSCCLVWATVAQVVLLQGWVSPFVHLEAANIRVRPPRKHEFLQTTDVQREQPPRILLMEEGGVCL